MMICGCSERTHTHRNRSLLGLALLPQRTATGALQLHFRTPR